MNEGVKHGEDYIGGNKSGSGGWGVDSVSL